MLDAFIIEQIKRREEERRQQRIQPSLEPPGRFPLDRPPGWNEDRDPRRRGDSDRGHDDEHDGVMIIDM